MNEKTFRTFCAVAIIVLFGLIGWAIYHHIEHDYYDHNRIDVDTPWFEYHGDHRVPKHIKIER